jgi:flagellin FlaB
MRVGTRGSIGGDDRGQVGIGILVMFVAMIVVSAIAAGVLVNMAGMMQRKATDAGEDAVGQLVGGVQVQDRTCTVSDDPVGIDEAWVHVRLRPGGNAVNMSNATVLYTDGAVHTELALTNATANGTHYTLMDDGQQVRELTNTSRMVRMTFDVAEIRGENLNGTPTPLENGEEATMTIATPQGAVTKVRLSPRGIAGTQSYAKC